MIDLKKITHDINYTSSLEDEMNKTTKLLKVIEDSKNVENMNSYWFNLILEAKKITLNTNVLPFIDLTTISKTISFTYLYPNNHWISKSAIAMNFFLEQNKYLANYVNLDLPLSVNYNLSVLYNWLYNYLGGLYLLQAKNIPDLTVATVICEKPSNVFSNILKTYFNVDVGIDINFGALLLFQQDLYVYASYFIDIPSVVWTITALTLPIFMVFLVFILCLLDLFWISALDRLRDKFRTRIFLVKFFLVISFCIFLFMLYGMGVQPLLVNDYSNLSLALNPDSMSYPLAWIEVFNIINVRTFSISNNQILYTIWEHLALGFGIFYLFILLTMLKPWIQLKNYCTMESLILILSLYIGGALLLSSANLLNVYISLELMTLSLYGLIVGNFWSKKDVEAGISYFFYGGLSSIFFLLGSGCIFFSTGSINYTDLALLNYSLVDPYGYVYFLGILLICFSFFVKFGFFPFMSWISTVYTGAKLGVVILFALFVKYFYLLAFMKFLWYTTNGIWDLISLYLQVIVCITIFLGTILTLTQQKLKPLFGFASLIHLSYLILILSLKLNVFIFYFYLLAYFLINLGIWGSFINLSLFSTQSLLITHLNGFYKHYPNWAIGLAILLCSNIGLPPVLGFFAKLFIFDQLISQGYFFLSIFLVILSFITAYYYLNIIKNMFYNMTAVSIFNFINQKNLYSFNFIILFCLSILNLFGFLTYYIFELISYYLFLWEPEYTNFNSKIDFFLWSNYIDVENPISVPTLAKLKYLRIHCINNDAWLPNYLDVMTYISFLYTKLHTLEYSFPWLDVPLYNLHTIETVNASPIFCVNSLLNQWGYIQTDFLLPINTWYYNWHSVFMSNMTDILSFIETSNLDISKKVFLILEQLTTLPNYESWHPSLKYFGSNNTSIEEMSLNFEDSQFDDYEISLEDDF